MTLAIQLSQAVLTISTNRGLALCARNLDRGYRPCQAVDGLAERREPPH